MNKAQSKRKTKGSDSPVPGQTVIQEAGGADKAKAAFFKSIKRKDDGSNEPEIAKFLLAVDRATSVRGSWSAFDILRECRGHELNEKRAMELLVKYIEVQEKFGKIAPIESIMDYPLWVRIS